METLKYHDECLLLLRLGLAFVFLSAAIIHSKDAKGRWSALHYTSLFLPGTTTKSPLVKLCGFIAVAIIYIGGIGLLIGVETNVSALLVFLVSACGFVIHMRDGKQAFAAATALESSVPDSAIPVIGRVKFSAMVGNASSAVKNVALMTSAVVLILEGGGKYSLTHVFGGTPWW